MRAIIKILAVILCAALLFCAVSCAGTPGETTKAAQTEKETTTKAQTETEAETKAQTETETGTETEAETEPPKPEIKDGMMIYYEDFTSYGVISDTNEVVNALGWKIQSSTEDNAPSDWTALLTLHDGVLEVINYDAATAFKGTDSFALMLTEEYMKSADEYGKYTLQYDLKYTGASNYKRYMNIVTEYNGDSYNSFIYRICGYGNNQCYYYGDWHTYDTDETDTFAAQKKNTETNTTIAYKLLGIESDVAVDSAIDNFKNVTVTIRLCRDVKNGCTVYMKTAEMTDFVLVSQSSEYSEGYDYMEDLTCGAVCFKAGGAINGTIDNIAIWTGFTDMPADKTVTYPG